MAKKKDKPQTETRYSVTAEYITHTTLTQIFIAKTPAQARQQLKERIAIQEKTGNVLGRDRGTETTELKITATEEL